jgi:EgtB-related family protein
MTDFNDYTPPPSTHQMSCWLSESQELTLSLLDDLSSEMLDIRQSEKVNLPLWEFGHVAWFSELWIHRKGLGDNPSFLKGSDHFYNSSNIAHDTRWQLELPNVTQTRSYLVGIFNQTQSLLVNPIDLQTAYFVQLAIFHQDMHNEAFAYTRQSLGYPLPEHLQKRFEEKKLEIETLNTLLSSRGDIEFDARSFQMGAQPGQGFFFDNEKWSHTVALEPFAISPSLVTNQEIIDFLSQAGADLKPEYWEFRSGEWFERRFTQWHKLSPQAIAVHLSYDLAQAYCACKGRRLPTEAERQCLGESSAFHSGQVAHSFTWEWTSSVFSPFEGFSSDPYRDYSEPWMDSHHQVLRGASWITPDRMKRVGYRNFYQKHRSDIFCGFRTCAM